MVTKKKATLKRKAEKRGRVFALRLSDSEHAAIVKAAGPYPVAVWARVALVAAAEAANRKGA